MGSLAINQINIYLGKQGHTPYEALTLIYVSLDHFARYSDFYQTIWTNIYVFFIYRKFGIEHTGYLRNMMGNSSNMAGDFM